LLTEARMQRRQTAIAAVETTLRLIDPNQKRAAIRPVVKRTKAPRFSTGEFTRTLMSLMRGAPGPMIVQDLVGAVAQAHGLDVSTWTAMRTLIANSRAAMSKPREGIIREEVGGVYQ
jgi:hypothetical protein